MSVYLPLPVTAITRSAYWPAPGAPQSRDAGEAPAVAAATVLLLAS